MKNANINTKFDTKVSICPKCEKKSQQKKNLIC